MSNISRRLVVHQEKRAGLTVDLKGKQSITLKIKSMKPLIVATDFSTIAQNATRYAIDMAQTIKAPVHLLHIYQLPVGYGDFAVPFSLANWEKETEDLLAQLKKHWEQMTDGTVAITTEVRLGGFLTELEAVCDRLQPYAVVMGSKGSTAAERLLFGTHAIKAMQDLPWPVITVPPGTAFRAVKKIGLACDLENAGATVPLEEISQLAQQFGASLHILHAGAGKIYDPQSVYLSGWLGEKLKHVQPAFHFLTGNTDQAILQFAEQHDIDLLIILPKRHGFWESLVYVSHTKQFVLHSHVPLMALHQETVDPY